MKWLKITGLGAVTAVFGGASFMQADYKPSEYLAMLSSPLDFSAYVPVILLVMAGLSAWQTIGGLFASPASTQDVEKVSEAVAGLDDRVIEGRTVTQGEAAKTRIHTSAESDRIIEALTAKFEGLGGEEKLSFERAAAHILESDDERDKAAADALDDGDIQEAVTLRRQRLLQENAYFDDMNKAHAAKWRDTGALAFPVNTAEATEAYESAIKYDGTVFEDYIYLSRLYQRGGDLKAAAQVNCDAKSAIITDRDSYLVLYETGVVAASQGDLIVARTAYEDGLKIAERLAEADITNTGFQRDLSVSYEKIGDVAVAQGDLTAARTAYEDSLKIAERLAEADITNTGFQRDLSVSYIKIGDVAVAQGDLTAARTACENGLKIAERLAEGDISNTGFQNDLSIGLERLGDIETSQGNLDKARELFLRKLLIDQGLVDRDRSNTKFQRDLSVSYNKIGDVARAQGDLTAARTAYEDGLKIRERLAEADSSNTGFQRDLSVSYIKIGDVARAQGDLTAARTAYEDGLKIREHLAEADISNTGFQRDLMVSNWNLANLGGSDAAGHWREAYRVLKALAQKVQALDAE